MATLCKCNHDRREHGPRCPEGTEHNGVPCWGGICTTPWCKCWAFVHRDR